MFAIFVFVVLSN